MQDQKSNLSIFNFSKKHISLLKQITVFFIPVLLGYALIEYSVLRIPMSYDKISHKIKTQNNEIKVMTLGSSQMQNAVNPEFLDKAAINYGSTSQHHNQDNSIMVQSLDKFPNLETIVFELSYSHLELPHNSKYFWKKTIYLKYYGVNAFEHTPYFKDKLVFLSNPSVYSKIFVNYYIKDSYDAVFNDFGYNVNNYKGAFSLANYDEQKIEKRKFMISAKEDLAMFEYNTPFFYSMIQTALDNNKDVIVSCIPTYKTYLEKRNPEILKRRDSVLKDIHQKFPKVRFLNLEEDTITFGVKDYVNENHLNPIGGEKFTKKLNQLLNE
ncbi:hypothetical protein SCB49_12419 [unidentified eubacterium SCB49]|nr:hypothetical protein SCB49_12419 [unidentified eubacterium SCB49]